jgi:hypothetical protein
LNGLALTGTCSLTQEHGVFVVRDGFHVVVTSCAAIESYQTTLRACLPLKQMKVVVAMD